MSEVAVKIIDQSDNKTPAYETFGAAGMDLRAFISESITLLPFERKLIPTGIFLELPLGYEAQVRPRSGLAIKNGITCLNSPGTVDSDYRGELKVILINLSNEIQTINNGDRIAQMVIAKYEKANVELVKTISVSERGAGGFGSTGSN